MNFPMIFLENVHVLLKDLFVFADDVDIVLLVFGQYLENLCLLRVLLRVPA